MFMPATQSPSPNTVADSCSLMSLTDEAQPYFNFRSSLLNDPDGRFVRTADRATVFKSKLGGQVATLEPKALAKSGVLGAAQSDLDYIPDISRALKYKGSIAAGDKLPSELTTGKPSWPLSPESWSKAADAVRDWTRESSDLSVPPEQLAIAHKLASAPEGPPHDESLDLVDLALGLRDFIEIEARIASVRSWTARFHKLIGDLMTLDAEQNPKTISELAQDSARNMRAPCLWLVRRVMELSERVPVSLETLERVPELKLERYAQINELAAFFNDVAPIASLWKKAKTRRLGLREKELQKIAHITSVRFKEFDPKLYRATPRSLQ